MESITLAVTQPVIDNVHRNGWGVAQIAIRDRSADLGGKIAEARASSRVVLAIGDAIDLQCGDNSAIWAAHQLAGEQADDFKGLFDFLARVPERSIEFACALRLI